MRERLLRTLTALLVTASLGAGVAPVAAHAQSAGDQQYEDPLSGGGGGGGGGNEDQSGSGQSGSGESGSGSGQSGSTGSGSAAGTQSTTPPATSADTGTASQLPRTGYPVWLAALAGAMLLGGGLALRASAGTAR